MTGARPSRSVSRLLAAAVLVAAACSTEPSPSSTPDPTRPPATLSITATGLGPCLRQWYYSCNYGIRVQGAAGYDRSGTFSWDEGVPAPGSELHGPNGNMPSTGVFGDVPTELPAGDWSISFGLWYGSDAGEPSKNADGATFVAACSTQVDTAGQASVTLTVLFSGSACTVDTRLD